LFKSVKSVSILNSKSFIPKRKNFSFTYEKYKRDGDYIIDLVKDHGLGFYKKYEDDIFDEKLPEWYEAVKNKNIFRLVVKNLEYISFNSLGYYLIFDLYINRKISAGGVDYSIPSTLEFLFIVDEEFILIQDELFKKDEAEKEKLKKEAQNGKK